MDYTRRYFSNVLFINQNSHQTETGREEESAEKRKRVYCSSIGKTKDKHAESKKSQNNLKECKLFKQMAKGKEKKEERQVDW